MNTTKPKEKPFMYLPGINPKTGEVALRTRVYEVLKTFPRTNLSASDITELIPEANNRQVTCALQQIVKGDGMKNYPHIHRPRRGLYRYDNTIAPSVMVFPAMSSAQRKVAKNKGRRNHDILVASQATVTSSTPAIVAPEVLAPRHELIHNFVASFPVFSEQLGDFLPTDQVVMLRDSEGRTWLAKRI